MSYRQTRVRPREYYVDNFGSDIQAVTFSYNGVVHSINRRGKRNIRGFLGKGTYTFTNGTDKFVRMNPERIKILSMTHVNGTTVPHNVW